MNATQTEDPRDAQKRAAGHAAAATVCDGMAVGLGHGSTAIWATRRIAERFGAGELPNLACVPCSLLVEAEARRLNLPLSTLEQHPELDLTIDGADEVDPQLNLIKGRGGALLREKVVAQASRRLVIVVDESKLSTRLGSQSPLPVEVTPFALGSERRFLDNLGLTPAVRPQPGAIDGRPFATDSGNYILDCVVGPEADPLELVRKLDARAGIMGHGFFLNMASEVLVAGADGIRRLEAPRGSPAP